MTLPCFRLFACKRCACIEPKGCKGVYRIRIGIWGRDFDLYTISNFRAPLSRRRSSRVAITCHWNYVQAVADSAKFCTERCCHGWAFEWRKLLPPNFAVEPRSVAFANWTHCLSPCPTVCGRSGAPLIHIVILCSLKIYIYAYNKHINLCYVL